MTSMSTGTWHQTRLCILTFVLGAVTAFAFLHFEGNATTLAATPPPTADSGILPGISWSDIWTIVILFALAATIIAIAIAMRQRSIAREHRGNITGSPDTMSSASSVASSLVPSPSSSAQVERARDEVERQLAELVGYVSRYLDQTSDQAAVFATAQSNLAGAGTIEQVQEVIQLLIANNAIARQNADDLRASLVEAKSESAKLQASLRKAETLATVDGLTNLPNRRRFQQCLEEQVAQCHREHTPLSLIMADLDHFKAINDKFGHLSGDAVLKTFATVIAGSIRSTDVPARYGGEEFAIILPKTPLGSASVLAETLRRKTAMTHFNGANPKQRVGSITASFGVAEIREDETVEELIERADQKLYAAKRKGRNRVELDHTVQGDER